MSKFQIITITIFILAIIGGVASFAMYKSSSSTTSIPGITVWGTFPTATFNEYVSSINNSLSSPIQVSYVEYKPENFSSSFTNALALGSGPDAVLLPAEMLLPQMNKLTIIPYTTIPERDFLNTYIDEAKIYLSDSGTWAIPFTVDPLMMYWNRDAFNAGGIATYPQYWEEFVGSGLKPGLVQKLTSKDQNGNVRKAAIAMGDFSNIVNAREVIGSLLLQSGNPVTTNDSEGGVASAISPYNSASTVTAFKYFGQFVDPSNANYSWNKGMVVDRTAFLSGTLSTYFSFASELSNIRAKNPNLNFDIAPLPQWRTGGQKAAYAKMYGFSFVRASANLDAAYQVVSILTSATNLQNLSLSMYLPSVRRDVIALGSTDPYLTIFNQAALISKTWLDADSAKSRQLFGNIIVSQTSGQKSLDQAIRDASDQYDVILRQAGQ